MAVKPSAWKHNSSLNVPFAPRRLEEQLNTSLALNLASPIGNRNQLSLNTNLLKSIDKKASVFG